MAIDTKHADFKEWTKATLDPSKDYSSHDEIGTVVDGKLVHNDALKQVQIADKLVDHPENGPLKIRNKALTDFKAEKKQLADAEKMLADAPAAAKETLQKGVDRIKTTIKDGVEEHKTLIGDAREAHANTIKAIEESREARKAALGEAMGKEIEKNANNPDVMKKIQTQHNMGIKAIDEEHNALLKPITAKETALNKLVTEIETNTGHSLGGKASASAAVSGAAKGGLINGKLIMKTFSEGHVGGIASSLGGAAGVGLAAVDVVKKVTGSDTGPDGQSNVSWGGIIVKGGVGAALLALGTKFGKGIGAAI